ncbi:hypothetical protein PKO51_03710 [Yokenella regensburgei]|uniref:hypothetical protein n=1 Tax=Yokenella regensburgei TaxID=158877 RepID=UPI0027D99766|nr:hypothetical protein [Yokenella regensburgei]MDQ4428480.1 hypothetical protein [Yokenella regensburgei]
MTHASNEKPLVYLLNTPLDVEEKLQDNKFNAHHYWLNGSEEINTNFSSIDIDYANDFPGDLHEAEIVVIDTLPTNHHIEANSPVSVHYRYTPSSVNYLPLDMYFVIRNIFQNHRKQIIVVFCESLDNESYQLKYNEETNVPIDTNTYPFSQPLNLAHRVGKRILLAKGDKEKEIKNCLSKYIANSSYKLVFTHLWGYDTPLLTNEAGEIVAMMRFVDNKSIIFLPSIDDKKGFLLELFDKVLPEHPDFKILFPENGSFSWMSNPSYISIEERNKIIDVENELKRHEETIALLKQEYESIHNKDENIKLRNILKETGDELVYSVKWFLEYIGFTDIVNPDEKIKQEDTTQKLFEEDLNFEYDGLHFLMEVKGIGGTSKDSECSQVSKIELRRRGEDKGKTVQRKFKSVYVVNHQRYREPKERQAIPFTPEQIENAQMTYRAMTYTYELFNVYHMIENGILKKEAVREAFKQDGVINFRESLISLTYNNCFKRFSVYSFTLDGTYTITRADKLAILDNQYHWHLLDIVNLQVNTVDVDQASEGNAGLQVAELVEGAKEYYLVKA